MAVAEALDRGILEAAASWHVELRCTPDEATRAAHQSWLLSDPRHLQAWQRLARLQDKFEQVAPGIARPTLSSARAKRREVLKLMSLLLAAGGAGSLAWTGGGLPRLLADQRTAVGEHRSLRLADGSRLHLNTATAVDVRYDDRVRSLNLLSGEILVETARDGLSRPFVVHTAQGSIRALGTRFIVRSDADSSWVCVLEHAVEVRNQSLALSRVEAGQQLRFRADQLGMAQAVGAAPDAWTQDMLVVNDWRLADLVSELQRYRPGHLGCAADVGELRLSGAFHLGNTDTILENLATTLPIRIRHFSRFWTRVEAA
ncbi:transmembrane sensor [Pseudomonas hunanensis]|uniref:Transmembrane sensor n=1 Tax=Pseudomonas hunanensis TaxID=1247546 RepID=A0ACC6KA29_9PSED|nr:FecR domain-containing protein [Pseudomonas hunanensis]MDR6715348.1 transmembrane sensor [Pseudomonas hunanensis]